VRCMLLLVSMMLYTVAQADDEADPWVGMNRMTHRFNDVVDRILLRPVARGYDAVMPRFARAGIRHFYGNLGDVGNAVNNVLQGKIGDGMTDVVRVLLNSTVGVGGLFDPASKMGLPIHEEDFGQTLSVWGLPRGPYLVIPFLGPGTVTDALGLPVDSLAQPLRYYHPVDHRNVLMGTELIDKRAGLLAVEKAVFGDKYIFYREAYLQRREYLIADGAVVDDF
jgi:phospholipid-binding lipoprotein MlaA